jgi:ATP-dependent DNA ligase
VGAGKHTLPGPYSPIMLFRSSPAAAQRRPPGFIEPCIPTTADMPPAGPAWSYEIKHDGYRLMACRDGERVRLFTRRGFDWTQRYPWIVHSARRLPVARFLIDGEVVACGDDGVADFAQLHSQAHDASAFLYAFDLDIRRSSSLTGAPSCAKLYQGASSRSVGVRKLG